jgi:hypothetical protein
MFWLSIPALNYGRAWPLDHDKYWGGIIGQTAVKFVNEETMIVSQENAHIQCQYNVLCLVMLCTKKSLAVYSTGLDACLEEVSRVVD